jgi:ribose transport system substrate-binding protein
MIMKRISFLSGLILFVGLILITASGCGGDKPSPKPKPAPPAKPEQPAVNAPDSGRTVDGSAQGSDAKKVYRFAFIPKAKSIPVFNYAKIGAERQAKALGDVEILWDGPDQNDALKQKEILDGFIAQKVDGIAISCLNGDVLKESIDRAVKQGIPVVTWDSDAPASMRLAFYGVNDFEAGVIMGKEAERMLGEAGGEIAVLTTLGADNLNKRLEGALSVIRQHPQMKVVETFDVKDDAVTAARVIATASQTYPNLKAWLSFGGWPGFSMNILDPVNSKQTYVICFDTIPPAPKLIKAGKIQMALGQKYFGWGSVPTRVLYDAVVNKKLPEKSFLDSGVDVVTPGNVEEYLLKWAKMEKGEVIE